MKGEIEIRMNSAWWDVWELYGLSMEDGGLSQLMTPAPHKEPVQNKNMAMHGTHIVGGMGYKDVRQLSLPVHFTATSRETFLDKYSRFCRDVLDSGYIILRTRYMPGVVFRFRYVSCDNFSQFQQRVAKFTLTLEEYDPSNRSENSSETGPSFTPYPYYIDRRKTLVFPDTTGFDYDEEGQLLQVPTLVSPVTPSDETATPSIPSEEVVTPVTPSTPSEEIVTPPVDRDDNEIVEP